MNVCQGYETFVAELLSIGKANYKAAYFSDFKHTNRYYENLNYASPTCLYAFFYTHKSLSNSYFNFTPFILLIVNLRNLWVIEITSY